MKSMKRVIALILCVLMFGAASGIVLAQTEGETASEQTGETLCERVMACETLEEIFTIIDAASEEEILALSEDEVMQIEAKITELEPEPLPPVIIEETTDEPVPSEIIVPAVNFDNVAPLCEPVVG